MAGKHLNKDAFVAEYLKSHDAVAAYKAAGGTAEGYTASAAASRMLKDVKIQEAVNAVRQEIMHQTAVDQAYVVNNLVEILERCMERAPVMVRRGRQFVQATDEEGRHVWAFNAKGALGATKQLGDTLGIFKEHIEHSGRVVVEVQVKRDPNFYRNAERLSSLRNGAPDAGAQASGPDEGGGVRPALGQNGHGPHSHG